MTREEYVAKRALVVATLNGAGFLAYVSTNVTIVEVTSRAPNSVWITVVLSETDYRWVSARTPSFTRNNLNLLITQMKDIPRDPGKDTGMNNLLDHLQTVIVDHGGN